MKKDIELLKEVPLNLEVWKTVGEKQHEMMMNDNTKEMASFEYLGQDIVNPFLSPCGSYEVNPYEKYGTENFLGWVEQYLRISKKIIG